MTKSWDVIVVGGGTVGMTAAIFASRRGGRVLVLEAASEIGGTLHISSGRMSAAGTKLQAKKGIEDTADEHYDDVMRICRNTADPALVRLAVDHSAETFDWLCDLGLPLVPSSPVYDHPGSHEPYLKPRYAWGVELGRSILRVLRPQFYAEVATGNVAVKTRTRVHSLIQDPQIRAVSGVRAKGADGGESDYFGSNVLLATGGFAASPAMVAEIHGSPLYSIGAWPQAQGDGLRLGRAVGGYVRGGEHFHANFGVVLESYDYPAETMGRAITMPEVRPPWEIYVDSRGDRFVAEDERSIDARERELIALPDRRYWIVFDERALREAPPLMEFWSRDQMVRTLGNHVMFQKGASLEELAHRTGMDPARLTATVTAYNGAFNGEDPMGRKHRPAPILEGPFYAVRQHSTLIVSTAGLVADAGLRVVDKHGRPIPNLYAAGEVLGSVATMGDAAANGMLVTPALTFGRLLGEKLLTWPSL